MQQIKGIEMELETDEVEIKHAQLQQRVKPTANVEPVAVIASDNQNTSTLFAATAPYWLNGLHNREGIALADEINQVVFGSKLAENKDAIAELLDTYSQAKKLGLNVVPQQWHLEDPLRKMNLAEPCFLLDGAFVRDKDGTYRPKEGGRAVLVDKGNSLLLKNKTPESYEAAVALAQAKGWTAISLTGKPQMMEQAWIAAKLAGIEVINYEPSKEAKAKFAERLAERQAGAEMHQEAAQCVSEGRHSGKILAIEDGQAVQKIGRDPDVTVRHDISKLSRVPEVGAVEDISYDKSGRGIVKDRAQEKAIEH